MSMPSQSHAPDSSAKAASGTKQTSQSKPNGSESAALVNGSRTWTSRLPSQSRTASIAVGSLSSGAGSSIGDVRGQVRDKEKHARQVSCHHVIIPGHEARNVAVDGIASRGWLAARILILGLWLRNILALLIGNSSPGNVEPWRWRTLEQGLCGHLYERLMQTNMLGALAPLRLRDPCPTASAGPTVQLFAGPLSHRLFGAVAPLPLRDCCPRCGTVAPLFALRALLFDVVLRVVVRSYDLYM